MRRFLCLALLASFPLTAQACMNDRDSDALAVQNQRFPDALRVITGRFERNPPRYYQMRIERVQTELKSNPRQFNLYDDLAVAHDRLGDDVMAMRVMAVKKAHLPPYNAHDKANKEAWYRYYANDGTFRAHNFLHSGAKIERIGEMRRARNEIARALKIKPNAHFNREKYQLAVMDWIVAVKTKKTKDSLADSLASHFYDEDYSRTLSQERRDTAQGLSGLIVLGAAWQSPDVFDALANALDSPSTIALSHLARKRCGELQRSGFKSQGPAPVGLDTVAFDMESHRGLNEENAKTLDALYPRLRLEADNWLKRRNQWIEGKLAQGQHPDTSRTFWQNYTQTSPPSLDVAWFNKGKQQERAIINTLVVAVLLFVVLPITGLVLLVVYLRRRARRQTSPA